MFSVSKVALCALFGAAAAMAVSERDLETVEAPRTAHVYLNDRTGPSQHYAAGFIYGIPDTPNQIPDHFYSDIKFQYTRAGGAQTPESKGWIGGLEDYKFRWESTLSNYRTARQHGGRFILLVHDLWGADSLQPADAPFPGDNGDWAYFDEFISTLIGDLKSNGATKGLTIDVWNEPNLPSFWNRTQDQYLQMWGRAHALFKDAFPSTALSGPSFAGTPNPTDNWWLTWASFVTSNHSLPDEHTWHSLVKSTTTTENLANYDALLALHGATRTGPANINEYGHPDEQTPAGGAWWIAQLERENMYGLRANWASAYALHDYLGQLLGKPGAGTDEYERNGTGYWGNAEYAVYKYYGLELTGERVRTAATKNGTEDVYATVDYEDRVVRVLAGSRLTTGEWEVSLEGLSALGLKRNGKVQVRTLEFAGSDDVYARVDGPIDHGVKVYKYSRDELAIPVYQEDTSTAWAFEIRF
ncbi:glycoside hydrolase superfamily [Aspergillus crustosus]